MLEVLLHADAVQRDLISAQAVALALRAQYAGCVDIAVVGSQRGIRRRLTMASLIRQAVEAPLTLRSAMALVVVIHGGPRAEIRPPLRKAGRRAAAEQARHDSLESQMARDKLQRRTQRGQTRRRDASGNFNGGPADRWGQSVRRVQRGVREEDGKAVGRCENHAVWWLDISRSRKE